MISDAIAIEKLIYQGSMLLISATTTFLGIVTFRSNTAGLINRVFLLFSLSISLWSICLFFNTVATMAPSALLWVKCLHGFAMGVPAFFFLLTIAITQNQQGVRRAFYFIIFLLLINLVITFSSDFVGVLYNPKFGFLVAHPRKLYPLHLAAFFSLAICAFWVLIREYIQANGLRRIQLEYFLLATLIGSIGGVTNYLINYGIKIFPLYPFGNCAIILYALITVYAIVRYRLLDVNLAITRTAVFVVVYAAVLGLPLWAALSWQELLEQILGHRWWALVLLVYAALATAAHYTNMYFQRRAEDRLMAEQRRYQSVLRQAAQGMILIKEMKKLLSLVVHLLTQKVRLKHAAIYLWDEKTRRFYCQAARQWPVKEPPPFAPGDAMVEYINWHRTPVVTEELYLQARGGAKELQGVVTSLKNLQAAVLIPSFTENRCEGFLLLGDKVSGSLFTSDDLQVFQVLASQTALAIENAQFYEELKRTQADLFQTAKMASLGHMAGGMSHQINNRFHVLTILAGTLRSVMQDSNPTTMDKAKLQELWGKAVETLSKLEDNAFRGGDIVKTLLKFSRPSGDYKLLSLAQVVKTARDVAQFRVNLASIDFQEDVPEDLPQVRGDMNQLADSVFNLITNAFDAISKKATMLEDKLLPPAPNDSVPFRGRLWARAYSEKKDDKDYVILEFQDNGVGMTSAELDNIFVPFFTTKATAQKGTGLGLYVIQRIVEQHGGVVNAKSKYGVGTTFTFRLPANTEAAPAIAPEEPKAKVA